MQFTNQVSRSYDEDGYMWVNNYILIKTVGKGAYGKVKLAVNAETGEEVAIKVCNKEILSKRRKAGFNSGKSFMVSATTTMDEGDVRSRRM